MSTIEQFGYRVQHLAFSAKGVILSRMEQEQFVKPIYRVVWSEWLSQLHGEVRAQMCVCTKPRLAGALDAILL